MSGEDLVSPWVPMSNPKDLKVLGKFIEEAGEVVSAASRCLIQGINEKQPVTGKVNREWLEEEIADLYANLELIVEHFDLDLDLINPRADRKKAAIKSWLDMLIN